MAYKMKGHTLPGINQKSEGKNMADGRAKSSAFQKEEKASPVAKKKFPKGTVDVSKRNVSTSKKRRSKPKVFLDKSIEQIQTEWKEKKKNEQSKKENNSTNTNTNTKPKKKAEKRNMKVVNPTLVKGVDY